MTQEDLAPDDIIILDTWDQVNLYDACKKMHSIKNMKSNAFHA